MDRAKVRLAEVVAAGVVGALAVRAAGAALARRVSELADPALDALYELPEGVIHRDVPTHDGGTVHVIERGSGQPIVFVHGVTLQAAVWAPMLHLLSDRYRVVAVDVRGHGASVVGDDGVGRVAAARDLAAVLDLFDRPDAVLCGHSMGGMIIGELCARHPEVVAARVGGVLLMNTAVSRLVPRRMQPVARRVHDVSAARARAGGRMPRVIGDNHRSLLATRVAFGAHPSGAAVEQVRHMGADVDLRYYVPLWADLLDYDGEAGLESLDVPAVVLTGSRDLLTPPGMARRIVEHLRHGELHVIEGAGHQLMQERPHEVAAYVAELAERVAVVPSPDGAPR
jgi:pimeloyl-ACP methyl ester carboxylesterase